MKMTPEKIKEAVKMAREGKTYQEIANQCKVTVGYISELFNKLRNFGVEIPRKKNNFDFAQLAEDLKV